MIDINWHNIYRRNVLFLWALLSTLWTFASINAVRMRRTRQPWQRRIVFWAWQLVKLTQFLGVWFWVPQQVPTRPCFQSWSRWRIDRYVFVQHRFEQENASGTMPKTALPIAPAFRFKSCLSSFCFLLGIHRQSIRFCTWPNNWPWPYQADRKKKKKNKTLGQISAGFMQDLTLALSEATSEFWTFSIL